MGSHAVCRISTCIGLLNSSAQMFLSLSYCSGRVVVVRIELCLYMDITLPFLLLKRETVRTVQTFT